jgi:hypothetical protein
VLADDLRERWSASGPPWDALGVVAGTGGIILVEGKANVPDIVNGPSCGSGSSGSTQGLANRQRIERAFAATRKHFGVPEEVADAWINSHCYQYANRLAHLCFFERHGVPALLVHAYFLGDETHLPTTAAQFEQQRRADAEKMGLTAASISSAPVLICRLMPTRTPSYGH